MFKTPVKKILLVLGILYIKTIAFAVDYNELEIHGFISQGFLKSSQNSFLGDSKEGTFQFNETGFNIALHLTDEIRFGLQFFSRNLGFYDDNDLKNDWAFFDYSCNDWLGFRVGKIKMPFGLYNRQRDADTLRTSVLLPQSVYPEGIRNFVMSFQGSSAYGSYTVGYIGDIDYEIFIGTKDIKSDILFVQNVFQTIEYNLKSEGFDYSTTAQNIDYSDININIPHMEGCMLMWNTPVSGSRIGVSYLQGNVDLKSQGIKANIKIDKIIVLSAEYEIGELTLMAEYLNAKMKLELPPSLKTDLKMEGWYAGASLPMWDRWRIGASYGEYYPNADDKKGDVFKNAGLEKYYAWQKDTTTSIRYDVNQYMIIKFETHFMNGTGLCNLANNLKKMKKSWVLYTAKVSLSF